jgi:hypothetical protein
VTHDRSTRYRGLCGLSMSFAICWSDFCCFKIFHHFPLEENIIIFSLVPTRDGTETKASRSMGRLPFWSWKHHLSFEFKVACEVLCDHVALKVSLCFLEVVVIYWLHALDSITVKYICISPRSNWYILVEHIMLYILLVVLQIFS